ncbi:MAG TPA: transcription elongation factor GreA [bacterium]|jgi:transcription elongation factor GreA|nr:MAG: Transcription elongation factor GreA [Parcubacteria group bacterium ADurb.Bin016]HNQ45269.1 transcription elongation factor GreA [bacterium]HNU89982.1 transcription elongation factor GreA [bacterium]HOE80957.1 transcription elongation factor GreA [bacterium]HOR69284.1 transcription elongation factor GreA [bacterium]
MASSIISREGYQKLVDELNILTTQRRREIAERIEQAKELGDLSENAEYSDAKEDQAFNEGRILELSNLLKNLIVVDPPADGRVGMGSKLVVETNSGQKEFTIVSFNESDPLDGKISNESPLGRALLNHVAGDKIRVNTPKGYVEYTIISVNN